MILHMYFARKFLWSMLLIFAIFVVILALIDLVDKLQDFSSLPFADVLGIVLLKIPEDTYEILPLVIVLATVALTSAWRDPLSWSLCAQPGDLRCAAWPRRLVLRRSSALSP